MYDKYKPSLYTLVRYLKSDRGFKSIISLPLLYKSSMILNLYKLWIFVIITPNLYRTFANQSITLSLLEDSSQ